MLGIYYILKNIILTVLACDTFLHIMHVSVLGIHIYWCLLLSNFIIYLILLLGYYAKGLFIFY